MTPTTPAIPADPAHATHSSNSNIHRLVRVSPGVLVLEPGNAPWWAALVFLALSPIVLGICVAGNADLQLTIALSLFPLFGAAGFFIGGFFFHKFGTRARFDRDQRIVCITGFRHGADQRIVSILGSRREAGLRYRLEDVHAVQFCGKRIWDVCQVNLVIGVGKSPRINLLNSGGKRQLHRIAKEIAEFIGVPFFVGSEVT